MGITHSEQHNSPVLNWRTTAQQNEQLRAVAAEHRVTLSELFRTALEHYLEDLKHGAAQPPQRYSRDWSGGPRGARTQHRGSTYAQRTQQPAQKREQISTT